MSVSFKHCFVNRVIDGDTIVVTIPDTYPIFGGKIHVRLSGINCPELKNKDGSKSHEGVKARQFTERFVRKSGFVDLFNVKRGKYFRLLALVSVDDVLLNSELLKNGLAVPYKC